MSLFRSGADYPDPDKEAIPKDEDRVLDKFARWVVKRRLAVPAILFIESGRPLNYIFSQAMVMSEPIANPFLQVFFNIRDYDIFQQAMERRENVENLLLKIEEYDAQMVDYEKALKKFLKQEKKKWKWHQRWIGITTPKVHYPEELRAPKFVLEEEAEKKKKQASESSDSSENDS